jgi:hypothetical protein
MPVTKCDLSGGPYHGTIYINYADQRNGEDDTDIWLTKSTDGGNTWSESVRINDDPPGNQQFFTWMDVDQVTGYLWFVFYDRRNWENNLTDVYMAVSKDGGETFTNFKVNDEPFLALEHVFFGDYNNISAYNNVIRPIWTSLHTGELSVWTAIVNPDIVGLEEVEDYVPFTLEQNYPNPFAESTWFSFKLNSPSMVSLEIYDIFGRLCATPIQNEVRMPGKYIEHFDASTTNLTPGVYYFSLMCNDKTIKKKMLFLR